MSASQTTANLAPLGCIEGVRVALRLVEPDDADFIFGLRTNSMYNRHLSPVTGGPSDQRAWIERYKLREAAGQEYYYVIERIEDRVACGTVRLYDIKESQFTWGSWILDENKPPKAALESACLSFGIAFDTLCMKLALIDVRKDNLRAIAFYRRFNMKEMATDERDIYFRYTSDQYYTDIENHLREVS